MRYAILMIMTLLGASACTNHGPADVPPWAMVHAGEAYEADAARDAVVYAWGQHMGGIRPLSAACAEHVRTVPIWIMEAEDRKAACSGIGTSGCYTDDLDYPEILMAPRGPEHAQDLVVHELTHAAEMCAAAGEHRLKRRSARHDTTEIWGEGGVVDLARSVM